MKWSSCPEAGRGALEPSLSRTVWLQFGQLKGPGNGTRCSRIWLDSFGQTGHDRSIWAMKGAAWEVPSMIGTAWLPTRRIAQFTLSQLQARTIVGRLPWQAVVAAILMLLSAAGSLVYIWWLCPLTLAPDEAHYWDWSRNIDWSYYSKGPLVAWLIRWSCEVLGELSIRLTGDLAAAVRTPAVACHVAILASWYWLAAGLLRSASAGLLIVVCGIALPAVRAGAVLMTIDPPFLACWGWALVCVWKALESDRIGWWVGAALLTALGILAKFTMLLFPAAVLGYLLWHRRRDLPWKGIGILMLGTVIGWLPILFWNAHHDWVSFRHVFGQVGGSGRPATPWWLGPVTFLGSQFGVLFAVWLVVFWLAAWRYRPTHETDNGMRLLWWCAIPVWSLFALASCIKPGQPNWPAPAYIAGLVLAIAWVRDELNTNHRRLVHWLVVATTLVGFTLSLALHFPVVVRPWLASVVPSPSARDPLPIRQVDMTARLAGWDQLAKVIDDVRSRERARSGQEPVLAGTHWTIPGALGFYCNGHPQVFAVGIPNQSDRHSQYDLWRPNPVWDAQVFRGRTFVIVGDIAPHMLQAFRYVEPPIMIVHTEKQIPLASWSVWVCHGFRGNWLNERQHKPGY